MPQIYSIFKRIDVLVFLPAISVVTKYVLPKKLAKITTITLSSTE